MYYREFIDFYRHLHLLLQVILSFCSPRNLKMNLIAVSFLLILHLALRKSSVILLFRDGNELRVHNKLVEILGFRTSNIHLPSSMYYLDFSMKVFFLIFHSAYTANKSQDNVKIPIKISNIATSLSSFSKIEKQKTEEFFLIYSKLLAMNDINISEEWLKSISEYQIDFSQIITKHVLYRGIQVISKESIIYNENTILAEDTHSITFHCKLTPFKNVQQQNIYCSASENSLNFVFIKFQEENMQKIVTKIN